MIYGYARVSSTEQNLDRQILALQKYVEPKNIVTDKQSGKNLDRPGYNALKGIFGRSEERRVGKECRSRWSPYH